MLPLYANVLKIFYNVEQWIYVWYSRYTKKIEHTFANANIKRTSNVRGVNWFWYLIRYSYYIMLRHFFKYY